MATPRASEAEAVVADGRSTRRWSGNLGVAFGADGLAVAWAFDVPAAFRSALDIVLVTRPDPVTGRPRAGWMRGTPPARSFAVGDMLHARRPATPPAGGRTWGEVIRDLLYSVQVVSASADVIDGRRVIDGRVTYVLTRWRDGVGVDDPPAVVTQSAFAALLRDGSVVPAAVTPE